MSRLVEGAVHVLGPEGSARRWRRLIKLKGFLVLHDAVWLRADPPLTVRDYWAQGQWSLNSM